MKPIFIISGEKNSGKTTFLLNIISLLRYNNFSTAGFVSLHDYQTDSYEIKDLSSNEHYPLMKRIASFEKRPHHFKFFQDGIEIGNECMKEILVNFPNIAVIDEIGRFELSGELWSDNFTQLVNSSIPLIFTTKSKLLNEVLEKWDISPTIIFSSVDFTNHQKAFKQIIQYL